jgi:hypothetical protein
MNGMVNGKMSNEIQESSKQDITLVLDKLSNLLENSIAIMEENRKMAIQNYNYFKSILETTHESNETISEDGVIEKATNESMKLVIDSAKTLESPIAALTKILTAKMSADAIKDASKNGKVIGPIDIERFK